MGIKYYLNLIKNENDIEAVKLRYFINAFLFVVYMIFIVLHFSLKNTNAVLSGICGMAGMLSLLLRYIADYRFNMFLKNIIENEPLDINDPADAAFIAYRNGFIQSNNQYKLINKFFFITQIIISALFITTLQVSIVLNITGNLDLSNNIFRVVNISILIFVAAVILFSFFVGAKSGVWYQNYVKELDIIKAYKAEQQGKSGTNIKQKYKILEDKKPKEQFKYLFTDEDLYINFTKLQKIGSGFGALLGGLLGISLIIPSVIFQSIGLNEKATGLYSGIIIAVAIEKEIDNRRETTVNSVVS